MNELQFSKEKKKAHEYFNCAVEEIIENEVFEDNIEELLKFLSENSFSIDDVLGFYSLSDLQDEEDIFRLFQYIHVIQNPKELGYVKEILAQNEKSFLVVADDI